MTDEPNEPAWSVCDNTGRRCIYSRAAVSRMRVLPGGEVRCIRHGEALAATPEYDGFTRAEVHVLVNVPRVKYAPRVKS
jgi:hypothetical protein